LSLHYIAQLNTARSALVEYRKFSGIKFEIQIRSILQHAWAEIEHDLGYKSEVAIPRDLKRRFSRLAGLLEIADDEFATIRDQLDAHKERATLEIAQGERALEIDQDSLEALVLSSGYAQRLDSYIVELAGDQELEDEVSPAYISRRTEDLLSVGFRTIGDVDDFLNHSYGLLTEFARRWITRDYPDPAEKDDFDETLWPIGVSLYYVFLLRVAEAIAQDEKFQVVGVKRNEIFLQIARDHLVSAYRVSIESKGGNDK
jgi:putative GTP pyrophosphokinase